MNVRGMALIVSAVLPAAASPMFAQQHDDSQPTRMRGTPPGRISSLGGVRSQPGVKSAAPRGTATPIRIAPLPNQSEFSRPIGSAPRVVPPQGDRRGGHGHHGGHDRTIRDGFTISGSFRDGPFTLVFSTTGLTQIPLPKHGCIIPVYTGGCAAVLPFGGLGCYFADSTCFSAGYTGIVGPAWLDQQNSVATMPATWPTAPSQEPPRPMTPLEHAAALLQAGEGKAAVAAYQAYLKEEPLDAVAMRALGLSLIEAGQVGDGVAVIGMAYRSDSTLAESPVSDQVYGKFTRFRSNLGRVSAYANREKSASAWLSLAVLMQAEGRNSRALVMIERASASGLEPKVAEEMTSALSQRPDVR